MSTNLESVLEALIPQGTIQQNKSPSGKSSQIVTQRIATTNQSNAQYPLGNEQPSFGGNAYEANYIFSPKHSTGDGMQGINSGNQEKINSTQSNMTTYYNSSLVSPVPTRIYQFRSSTYQSPDNHITAFNVGGVNTSAGYDTKTYKTVRKNIADREIDSTSQVQQELYKNSPLMENGSAHQTYEYKRIINGSGKTVINDGSVSPVNNLLQGESNSVDQKFFSGYGLNNQKLPHQSNITFQTLPSYQTFTTSYQPNKTIQQPRVNFSSNQNGTKQSFEQYNYSFKPSSVNKVTFGSGNGINKTPNYAYSTTYSSVPAGQQHLPGGNYTINNIQTTHTNTTVNQPLPISYTYHQSQIIPFPQQSTQLETHLQNQKSSEMYQIIDQIQRPKYQKLYGLEDENWGRRMVVEQDPPVKKGFCGPLCWLALVLIGAVLGLFGMLCGLGVVCPGGGPLKRIGSVQSLLIEPSVVLNTSQPQVVKVRIVESQIRPERVSPTSLEPEQLPSLNIGTPTSQIITPSFIPPISIAPSSNPVQPILPPTTIPIPSNTSNVHSYNASIPASSQQAIQIQPEVIKYDRKIDEYTIDATPHIVGVVASVNSEVVNSSVGNLQGISWFIDYTSDGIGVTKETNKGQVANATSTGGNKTEIITTPLLVQKTPQVLPEIPQVQLTPQVNSGFMTTVEEVVVKRGNTPNANVSPTVKPSDVISPDLIQIQPDIIPSTIELTSTTKVDWSTNTLPATSPAIQANQTKPDFIAIAPTTTQNTPIPTESKDIKKTVNSPTNNDSLELEAFTLPPIPQTQTTTVKQTPTTVKQSTASNLTTPTPLPVTLPNILSETLSPTISTSTQPSTDLQPLISDIEPSIA